VTHQVRQELLKGYQDIQNYFSQFKPLKHPLGYSLVRKVVKYLTEF
jgi:hypothetical protein